jgi:biotin carboxylase
MRDVFVVFEPFNHSYLVAAAAARRGLCVIAMHTLPIDEHGPYGPQSEYLSETHEVSSWLQPEEVAGQVDHILAGRRLAGTYAGPEITAVADAMIRSRHGLPNNEAAHLAEITDKLWVRRRLLEAGLTRLTCYDEAGVHALTTWPGGDTPFFFKPRNGGGSAYVKKVRDLAGLTAAITEWEADEIHKLEILRAFLKSGRGFFLEQGGEGELLSAEGFTFEGEYHFFGLTGRLLMESDPTVEVGSTFPRRHPRLEEIKAKAAAIHAAIGYRHGVSHVEFVVPEEGEIEMVEFNPRLAGVDNLKLFNLVCSAPLEEVLVDLGCASARSWPNGQDAPRQGVMNYVFSPVDGRIETLDLPTINADFIRSFKSVGDEATRDTHEFSYLAGFITVAEDLPTALDQAADIRAAIKVNGVAVADDPVNCCLAPIELAPTDALRAAS